jgi:acyl-CoA hydrolase
MADETIEDRSIIMSEVMTPEKANFAGNIHGGYLLSLLDKVAYACAARYSGEYVVTLSVDGVMFKEPIHVGELVICYASINHVGRSSMEVGIKVVAENLRSHEQRHTNSCYFTMIAVDENLRPKRVKSLSLTTPEQHKRFKEAELRKQLRQTFAREQARLKSGQL